MKKKHLKTRFVFGLIIIFCFILRDLYNVALYLLLCGVVSLEAFHPKFFLNVHVYYTYIHKHITYYDDNFHSFAKKKIEILSTGSTNYIYDSVFFFFDSLIIYNIMPKLIGGKDVWNVFSLTENSTKHI